jgi:prephenate dehydratase
MIDTREAEIGEGQAAEPLHCVVGRQRAGADVVEKLAESRLVDAHYPASVARTAFLGPPGTFTEEALLTQADLAATEVVPMRTVPDVLAAVERGDADHGVVPIENAIEGTVNVTMDTLAFDANLLIQREVVLGVQLNLLALPGVGVPDVRRVRSIPVATAQCRAYLARTLPQAEVLPANSTAEAAKDIADAGDTAAAAIGTRLAAKLYGLDVVAADIEDHPENETRFVVVARRGIPAATGHDKTTIVCFQRADRPGALLAILQEFAARAINLTKLESRPTKRGLGRYCFIIDLEGHVDDELVADCLRDLRSKLEDVKFLGSYPAAGEHGESIRRDADVAWRAADEWIRGLRAQISGD